VCARLNSGAVKCWGNNLSGRLGVGDTATRGDGPGEMGDSLAQVNLGSATGSAVWGRVTNATTGAPLGGTFAIVMATNDFSVTGGAVAGSDGTFTVPVDPGAYFVYLIDGTGAHTAGFFGSPTTVTASAHAIVGNAATFFDGTPFPITAGGSFTASAALAIT